MDDQQLGGGASPSQINFKFEGGPKDGETHTGTVTGKAPDTSLILTFPIKDKKGRRVGDHIYRYAGNNTFVFQGTTEIRKINEWEDTVRKAKQFVKALFHPR